MPPAAAIAELRACAGSQLDPTVVDVLIACVETTRAPDPAPASVAAPVPGWPAEVPEPV